jgi:hypothetical protein
MPRLVDASVLLPCQPTVLPQETAQFHVGDLRDADDKADIDPAEVFTVVALGGGKVALKSGYDRYVGTTVHGKLVGFKEAIDQLETWTAELDEACCNLADAVNDAWLLQDCSNRVA